MDRRQKFTALANAAQFDLACACGGGASAFARRRGLDENWIYPAALPGGGVAPMLKVLTSSACERDCAYCSLRAGHDCQRYTFGADELAAIFDQLYRQRRIRGAFLSSAVTKNPVSAMDRILATAELLRQRYRFYGYLHLKVIPGAQRSQVERAVQLATRVSVNLEVPSARHLAALSSRKDFERDLLTPLRWIAELIDPAARRARTSPGQPLRGARSQTTQFVVGATDDTDREIIGRASQLYRELGLARAYYSKFAPRPGTPLAERPPTPFMREHRLYQSDFLLRSYGFSVDEIPFAADGSLALDQDPKQRWAALHPERFPIEVNRAPAGELLRVPGIGPKSVERIVQTRRQGQLHSLEELAELGVATRRAAPFVLIAGRRAAAAQLAFKWAV